LKFTGVAREVGLWKLEGMKVPSAILIKKVPATVKCPACSQTFCISSYQGSGVENKLEQVESEYQRHFKEKHSREDASQAAARIVREATKD